ncbi:MAG: NTP transferase domain-containing protein [Deltaproteobacteria bacterium]|nr:NTP transferase domain-containing protein [Deltaproteobacteria bacterium]MBW2361509.1 NTP transferase domain-containing protein [Deltaproteobacteria bacterium]
MKAVILAGGLGERLRPFTQAIPKPLLPVGEQSLIELQIQKLVEGGCEQIFLATNYKSAYIRKFVGDGSQFGIDVQISEETQPLGTCGPLSLLRESLDRPFIVMNGDILTTLDFSRFYEYGLAQSSTLTVATKQIRTPFNFGSVQCEGERIVSIEEKPDFITEIVAGIYFMRPAIFEGIPDDAYFGIDSLMQDLLRSGQPVARYLMQEYWLDIGRIEDYGEAEEAYETHFRG